MKSLLLETIDISTATVDFAPNYRQGILTFIIDQGELAYLISLEDEIDAASAEESLKTIAPTPPISASGRLSSMVSAIFVWLNS